MIFNTFKKTICNFDNYFGKLSSYKSSSYNKNFYRNYEDCENIK